MKYFWLITFQWPTRDGFAVVTFDGTFDIDPGTSISRTDLLAHLRRTAAAKDVPQTASVLFLTVEPEQITAPGVTR